MNLKSNDIWLGAGVVAFGIFLLVYAIPVYVSSPSNVRVLFLSPTFWPIIISWLIIILGASLIFTASFATKTELAEQQAVADQMDRQDVLYAIARLVAAAIIMAGIVLATPSLGMVLATGLAFALFSAVVLTPRPIAAVVVAIVLPLVLYAFFAHVAGVSVPQGRFLSLP